MNTRLGTGLVGLKLLEERIIELLSSGNKCSTSTLSNDRLLNSIAVVFSNVKDISIHKARQAILAKAKSS